jgi:hypothetical protein
MLVAQKLAQLTYAKRAHSPVCTQSMRRNQCSDPRNAMRLCKRGTASVLRMSLKALVPLFSPAHLEKEAE